MNAFNWLLNIAVAITGAIRFVLLIVPVDAGILEDTVHSVEENQVYTICIADNGWEMTLTPSLRQLVFRETDWQGPQIVDWKLWTKDCIQGTDHRGKYIMWHDASSGGGLRRVRFLNYYRTYTTYDTECVEREAFPIEWRRGLRER